MRNVDDMDTEDRHALEHVLGKSLREDQQLVIRIINRKAPAEALPDTDDNAPVLPEWCNVYAGLSEREIDDIEKIILQRADLGRPSE